MTRQDFLKRRAAFNNRVALGAMVFSAVFVPAALLIHHVYEDRANWPLALRAGIIAALGLVSIAGIVVLMTFAERQMRRFGMFCAHCGGKIGGRTAVDFNAGTCRSCDHRILED